MRIRFRKLLCFGAVLAISAGSAGAVEYQMLKLGIFETTEGYPPGSNANGINNQNQVVGSSSFVSADTHHAFLWDERINTWSPLQDLTPNGKNAAAHAINDNGQILINDGDEEGCGQYYVQQGSSIKPLSDASYAYGINSNGVVVGETGDVNGKACLWNPSATGYTMQLLDTLGGIRSYARAINKNGQIVGFSYLGGDNDPEHACIWNPTETGYAVQDLGTITGDFSIAKGINDSGTVVGISRVIGANHACIWSPSATGYTIEDLGTLGGRDSEALAINNSGLVVGRSQGADGHWHAFVWDPNATGNKMKDLGWLGDMYSSANAINDNGWIVGVAYDDEIDMSAIVWKPVPEPSSILALICGISGLGGMAWRKRNR